MELKFIYDLGTGREIKKAQYSLYIYNPSILYVYSKNKSHVKVGYFRHYSAISPSNWNSLLDIIKGDKLVGDNLGAVISLINEKGLNYQAKTNLIKGVKTGKINRFCPFSP